MTQSAGMAFLHKTLKGYSQAMGIVAYAGSQLLILIVLLKSGGFRAVGDFSLSQAIIAPVFGLVAFSLRPYWVSGVIRDLGMYQFFQLRIVSLLCGAGIAFAVRQLFFSTTDSSIFVFVFLLKVSELISDVCYGALDVTGRSATAGQLLMGKALAVGICAGICFLVGASIPALQSVIYLCILLALALELSVVRFSFLAFLKAAGLKRMLLASHIRLISWASVSSVVTSVTGFLPRYFLEAFHGREAVGYFSTVAIPASVVLMICTGLAQTELKGFSATYFKGDWPAFSGTLRRRSFLLSGLSLAVACAVAGLAVIVQLTFHDLLPAKFGFDASLIVLLFFPLYMAQLLSYAAMPLARIGETFAITLASLLFQISVLPTLVHWQGLYGAVAASMAGGIIQSAGLAFLVCKYFQVQRVRV
jgi:hypothetical protein